jgi:hypothetical protein
VTDSWLDCGARERRGRRDISGDVGSAKDVIGRVLRLGGGVNDEPAELQWLLSIRSSAFPVIGEVRGSAHSRERHSLRDVGGEGGDSRPPQKNGEFATILRATMGPNL